jgi:hypothetical protein
MKKIVSVILIVFLSTFANLVICAYSQVNVSSLFPYTNTKSDSSLCIEFIIENRTDTSFIFNNDEWIGMLKTNQNDYIPFRLRWAINYVIISPDSIKIEELPHHANNILYTVNHLIKFKSYSVVEPQSTSKVRVCSNQFKLITDFEFGTKITLFYVLLPYNQFFDLLNNEDALIHNRNEPFTVFDYQDEISFDDFKFSNSVFGAINRRKNLEEDFTKIDKIEINNLYRKLKIKHQKIEFELKKP